MDLKTILGNLGHEILNLASSGEEAVEKVGDLNPDLISIDLKLKVIWMVLSLLRL